MNEEEKINYKALCYDLFVNLGIKEGGKFSFPNEIRNSFIKDFCLYNRFRIARYFNDRYGAYQERFADGFIVHIRKRNMHKIDEEMRNLI